MDYHGTLLVVGHLPQEFKKDRKYRFLVTCPEGMTCRKSATWVQWSCFLPCGLLVSHQGQTANGKSIMDMVMLAAPPDSELELQFGEDVPLYLSERLQELGELLPDEFECSYLCERCGAECSVEYKQIPFTARCSACGYANFLTRMQRIEREES